MRIWPTQLHEVGLCRQWQGALPHGPRGVHIAQDVTGSAKTRILKKCVPACRSLCRCRRRCSAPWARAWRGQLVVDARRARHSLRGRWGAQARGHLGGGAADHLQHARGHAQSLLGSGLEEEGGRCIVARHTAPMGIHPSEVVLGLHVTEPRAVAIEGGGPQRVAGHTLAVLIGNSLLTQAGRPGAVGFTALRPRHLGTQGAEQRHRQRRKDRQAGTHVFQYARLGAVRHVQRGLQPCNRVHTRLWRASQKQHRPRAAPLQCGGHAAARGGPQRVPRHLDAPRTTA